MAKMNKKKLAANFLFWIGAAIIFITHIQILASGLPTSFHTWHAIFNLIAGAMVTAGYLIKK